MTNDNTRIEWTDATWNPVTGCSKVSDGCRFCYAEAVSHRWGHTSKPWTHPHAAENVVLHPDRLDQPLRWRRPRRIFVNSMSDLFHEQVSDEFIDRVFAIMALASQHTFQVLTKRPERMRQYMLERWQPVRQARLAGSQRWSDRSDRVFDAAFEFADPNDDRYWTEDGNLAVFDRGWPLSNVWLGTSVEDQRVDDRIGALAATPAAVRFLSCEPLIGPLRLSDWLVGPCPNCGVPHTGPYCNDPQPQLLHWVIVGGESGPNHRPIDPDWVRSLRDECVAAGVPFFFKQWGGRTPKAGGRELDGRTWDEMPATESAVLI